MKGKRFPPEQIIKKIIRDTYNYFAPTFDIPGYYFRHPSTLLAWPIRMLKNNCVCPLVLIPD